MSDKTTVAELSDEQLRELVAEVFEVEKERRERAEEQAVMTFLERREQDRSQHRQHA
jgi:hypothetical protein